MPLIFMIDLNPLNAELDKSMQDAISGLRLRFEWFSSADHKSVIRRSPVVYTRAADTAAESSTATGGLYQAVEASV